MSYNDDDKGGFLGFIGSIIGFIIVVAIVVHIFNVLNEEYNIVDKGRTFIYSLFDIYDSVSTEIKDYEYHEKISENGKERYVDNSAEATIKRFIEDINNYDTHISSHISNEPIKNSVLQIIKNVSSEDVFYSNLKNTQVKTFYENAKSMDIDLDVYDTYKRNLNDVKIESIDFKINKNSAAINAVISSNNLGNIINDENISKQLSTRVIPLQRELKDKSDYQVIKEMKDAYEQAFRELVQNNKHNYKTTLRFSLSLQNNEWIITDIENYSDFELILNGGLKY